MKRVIRNYVSEPSYKYNVCPLTRPSDTLSKSGEGNIICIKNDCSVCGKNVDENMMFSPLTLTEVNLTGEGRLTGRGPKSVILNSFQDLSFPQSIPHPSPLLLRRGNSIIVRSTVTDYSLFTIHYSLILMQTYLCPLPQSLPSQRSI